MLRREFCWLHIASDFDKTLSGCLSCVTQLTRRRHKNKLLLYPPSGPLEPIPMDILRALSETGFGNQYFLFT